MASITRALHPPNQAKPRRQGSLSSRQLDLIDRTLARDVAWSSHHLPVLRGAIDLLRLDQEILQTRTTALGASGATVISARIALLDAELVHLRHPTDLVRRARATLGDLVRDPMSPSSAGEVARRSPGLLSSPILQHARRASWVC